MHANLSHMLLVGGESFFIHEVSLSNPFYKVTTIPLDIFTRRNKVTYAKLGISVPVLKIGPKSKLEVYCKRRIFLALLDLSQKSVLVPLYIEL